MAAIIPVRDGVSLFQLERLSCVIFSNTVKFKGSISRLYKMYEFVLFLSDFDRNSLNRTIQTRLICLKTGSISDFDQWRATKDTAQVIYCSRSQP